jgi:hypothetical protein
MCVLRIGVLDEEPANDPGVQPAIQASSELQKTA